MFLKFSKGFFWKKFFPFLFLDIDKFQSFYVSFPPTHPIPILPFPNFPFLECNLTYKIWL